MTATEVFSIADTRWLFTWITGYACIDGFPMGCVPTATD
jgi:hypothetical protein